ncbi:MAG TPA: trigger factor [Chitinophagales bacterium]|nr:trigger factor [Chitinophagales bacterium]
MSVSYIDIDNASFELQLTLTPEEYAKKFKKNVNNFAQGVAMKGFRKGFTPVGMIMKLQGNQLLTQTLMELIDEQSENYIKENDLLVYISGNVSKNAFDEVDYTQLDKTYIFSITYIKYISFDLAEFAETAKHTFKKYVAQITDEDLNKEITGYLFRVGEVAEMDNDVPIEENDMVNVAFTAYDKDNNKIEEVSTDTAYLLPKLLVDESEKNKLIGKKLQESGTINLLKAFDKTDKKVVALQVLGLNLTDEETIQKMPDEYQFTITGIRRRVPAQLTEEVIFAAFPKAGAETEEEFKALFKGYLENQAYQHSKQLLKYQLITWMQHSNYNFPEEILENNYNRVKATGKSKDMLPWEEVRESEMKNLRLHSIVQSILRSQDIKVTEEELLVHTAADLKYRLVQAGYPESLEIEEEMAINYLNSDKEYGSTMLRHIATEKALEVQTCAGGLSGIA